MIALLTYPIRTESAAGLVPIGNPSFSHRIWELHRIISDPAAEADDVKTAKRSLLRTLRTSRLGSATPEPVAGRHFSKRFTDKAGRSNQELLVPIVSSNREETI
jgi:hypothetical protein